MAPLDSPDILILSQSSWSKCSVFSTNHLYNPSRPRHGHVIMFSRYHILTSRSGVFIMNPENFGWKANRTVILWEYRLEIDGPCFEVVCLFRLLRTVWPVIIQRPFRLLFFFEKSLTLLLSSSFKPKNSSILSLRIMLTTDLFFLVTILHSLTFIDDFEFSVSQHVITGLLRQGFSLWPVRCNPFHFL